MAEGQQLADPAVRTNVLLQVFIAGQLAGEVLGRRLRSTGLSPDHFAVLSSINVLGPVTPTELSRLLGMPPTTVSTWIRRLTVARQVSRRANPDDGRSALVETTAAGRAAIERAQPIFLEALGEVNAALGARGAGVVDAFVELQEALRGVMASENTTNS
jgi:DNA-binding MarR family transcriptional regulator